MGKVFFKGAIALLFNLIVCVSVSAATGFNPLVLMGGGMALSALGGAPASGGMNMAIQKEIWMNSIVEGLFADNSFLSKAFNADMFVIAGRTVHIPNAGAPSKVVKNRTEKPASVKTRTDSVLSFDLDEFTTDPIHIPHADTVELSYNKRESVLRQDKAELQDAVGNGFLFSWSPTSGGSIATTGAAATAHTPAATGNRKKFTRADVLAAYTKFNADDVPQTERYLLLDAIMYSQLLEDLTEKESQAFHAGVDTANGIVGKLLTFNVMLRSKALRYTGAGAAKEWTAAGAATDNAAALAWHVNSVCRALGEVVPYESMGDPTWYGDIYSFLVRAGGRPMRKDVKGLLAIIQATAA
jgi:hypothetical protein